MPGNGHHSKNKRDGQHPYFGEQNQLAAIDDVADRAGRQREDKEGKSRSSLREGHIHRPAVERYHQPGGPHGLHERADVGDHVGDQQVAEGR